MPSTWSKLNAPTKFIIIFVTVLIIFLVILFTVILKKVDTETPNNPYYIATGYSSDPLKTIAWSPDGTSWNSIEGHGFDGNGRFVAYYPTRDIWLATGTHVSDSKSTILWSGDGKTWNQINAGGFKIGITSDDGGYDITYDKYEFKWYAVGGHVGVLSTIQWSGDGKTWNPISEGGFSTKGANIDFDDTRKRFIAVGRDIESMATIQFSENGLTWSDATDELFNTTDGGVFVTGRNR